MPFDLTVPREPHEGAYPIIRDPDGRPVATVNTYDLDTLLIGVNPTGRTHPVLIGLNTAVPELAFVVYHSRDFARQHVLSAPVALVLLDAAGRAVAVRAPQTPPFTVQVHAGPNPPATYVLREPGVLLCTQDGVRPV